MGTTPSLSSTLGLPRTSLLRVRTSSLWRRWSPPLENSRISSSRRRSWLRTCKEFSSNLAPHYPLHPHHIHLMIDHSEIDTVIVLITNTKYQKYDYNRESEFTNERAIIFI